MFGARGYSGSSSRALPTRACSRFRESTSFGAAAAAAASCDRAQRQPLVVLGRELIVNEPNKSDSHLGRVVAPKYIANKVCLYLHLHHLERTS